MSNKFSKSLADKGEVYIPLTNNILQIEENVIFLKIIKLSRYRPDIETVFPFFPDTNDDYIEQIRDILTQTCFPDPELNQDMKVFSEYEISKFVTTFLTSDNREEMESNHGNITVTLNRQRGKLIWAHASDTDIVSSTKQIKSANKE